MGHGSGAALPGQPTGGGKRGVDAGGDVRRVLLPRRPRGHHGLGPRLAALTHGDRAAWEGTAVFHELVRVALAGDDPLAAVPDTLTAVHPDHRERYATVLAPNWHPDQATEFNGAVWPCLGSAVWALRTTSSYEDAVRAAIDLGGDTDTVAAVTGGLAGAAYGIDAVPERWRVGLRVPLPGFGERVVRVGELAELARRLGG
ncbi:ADP-ribosylglycohydrolase [Streptomyces sp. V4I8]